MARSFGCSIEEANEVVQEMYVRLHKYVDNPEKIMYNDKEVNGYYVYITLRNIYLSEVQRNNKKVTLNTSLDVKLENPEVSRLEAFDTVIQRIEDEVASWYWYDKKLWEIHFYASKSMRAISKDTTISLSSIFNTLKKSKNKIREKFGEDVEDYKNGDYDRI